MPAATKLQGYKGKFYLKAGDSVSTTGTWTSGSTALTVANTEGIADGSTVAGTGIAAGSKVVDVSGNTVTVDLATTAGGTATAITVTPPATSSQIAHCSGWDMDIKADEIDASDHDTQGWKDKLDGLREFSGTIDLMYFTNDASQLTAIDAILAGSVDIVGDFRPLDKVGEVNYTGTLRITGCKMAAKGSTAQAVNLTFSGRGALIRGVIA